MVGGSTSHLDITGSGTIGTCGCVGH